MRCYLVFAIALAALLFGGCAAYCGYCGEEHRSSSSLVGFLYPDGRAPPAGDSVVQLHVPLRVGLAFLPAANASVDGPDAVLREQLLERVRRRFSDRHFVSEIIVIPDYYLSTQRGFAGLEGVQRLYNVDVLALVSYDQVAHQDLNEWSLGYLTIVGMAYLKGNRYDVSTLVDLAVVDPASRALVLRAGGVNVRHLNTTLLDAGRRSRETYAAGFSDAADQMIAHFDTALTAFEAQVRAGHANVQVVHRDGTQGGSGAFSWPWLLPFVAAAMRRVFVRRSPDRRLLCLSTVRRTHPGCHVHSLAATVLAATAVISSLAMADEPLRATAPSTDVETQRLVYRLYSVMIGAGEFCRAPAAEAAGEFQTQLDRFNQQYPEFEGLLRASPYHAQSARQFARTATLARLRETPQQRALDCHAFAELLRSMIESAAGSEAVYKYEAQISH